MFSPAKIVKSGSFKQSGWSGISTIGFGFINILNEVIDSMSENADV